ncbi:tetratricopeptide repeat protein 39C-like isoform X2 [Hermetia illucens]|nr:tetratricopeptide repeat protein 39C-like isoform X2 [Hermetia illucens]
MKGSWLLRRAWKIYEQLYGQIYSLYKSISQRNQEATENTSEPITPSDVSLNTNISTIPHSQSHHSNFTSSKKCTIRTHRNTGNISRTSNRQHSVSTIFPAEKLRSPVSKPFSNELSLQGSCNSRKSSDQPSRDNLHLKLQSNQSNGFLHQVPLSCPEPIPSPMTMEPPFQTSDIDLRTTKRLMGAVSFGFGIFQLSVSLLPPNLLKLINFLGFEGNRAMGIACLNYARSTEDMRAPLATLALLWYYTIGAQLFHANETQLSNEIEAARQLLRDSRPEYATSAIFLFFNARLKRLQGKTDVAVDLYDAAYRMSVQRELKMLCLHEVGWCRLIHLDFGNAMLHFHELKLASSFSKSFYTYMTTICQGAFGRFENLTKLKSEIMIMISRNNKETQINKFILRRIDKLPSSDSDRNMFDVQYWKFFVYEMLFLWNTLHNCPKEVITAIISDCTTAPGATNEPSIGLANLILGACKMHLHQLDGAMQDFRECIRKRVNVTEDIYISAYANYELAVILLKQRNERAKQEAKNLLLNVQTLYKNYDFESRLSARVYAMLKHL